MSHTTTPEEQFEFKVLEFQQYYNENCTVYSQFIVVVLPQTVHVSPMKLYMKVATTSTHTKVVHTNTIHGSGHNQYTY